ncbi:MAG: hypothetical protein K9M84_03120 [Spirochaetia bacterium]|nr:hypothetical protein [Spirochaetia bacterium]
MGPVQELLEDLLSVLSVLVPLYLFIMFRKIISRRLRSRNPRRSDQTQRESEEPSIQKEEPVVRPEASKWSWPPIKGFLQRKSRREPPAPAPRTDGEVRPLVLEPYPSKERYLVDYEADDEGGGLFPEQAQRAPGTGGAPKRLDRLERYPLTQRAIVLSEIIGPPRSLQEPFR